MHGGVLHNFLYIYTINANTLIVVVINTQIKYKTVKTYSIIFSFLQYVLCFNKVIVVELTTHIILYIKLNITIVIHLFLLWMFSGQKNYTPKKKESKRDFSSWVCNTMSQWNEHSGDEKKTSIKSDSKMPNVKYQWLLLSSKEDQDMKITRQQIVSKICLLGRVQCFWFQS